MESVFEGWAIVELLGHRRIGAYVQEVVLAGSTMLRCDIPLAEGTFTQFYSGNAIYCISPVGEKEARGIAQRYAGAPVQRYELPGPDFDDEDE